MKTFLILSILLWAASAAPAENKEKVPEAAVEAPREQKDAPPEMEDKMTMMGDEVLVQEESVPDNKDARFSFCPDGWFSQGSRCFLFVNTPMSWYSAEEHCNTQGANLASVANPKEYSFLQQLTQTAGQSIAWLGGFSLQGRWMWIDREGFYYTNWYASSSSSSHPCIYLRSSNGWGNTACSSCYRFICSKDRFSC